MKYHDSKNNHLDTAKKILKVNHAGEFGAINIYKAQLLVCSILMPQHVPLLQKFLEDELAISIYSGLKYSAVMALH